MSRYTHTLLTDEAEALEVLPQFPSVFDNSKPQQQSLRATRTEEAKPAESVLPLVLPEKVAQQRPSVQLGAVLESDRKGLSAPESTDKKACNSGVNRQLQASESGENGIRVLVFRKPFPKEHLRL